MALTPAPRDVRPPAHREFGFDALQREIDRVFDSFAHGFPSFPTFDGPLFAKRGAYPSMDVAETDKEIEVTCELPGLEEKDVEISLADDVLTIKGEKRAERQEKDKNYQTIERSYGAFTRQVTMPSGVDPDSIKASMKQGVLRITALKPKAVLAKQIPIKPAT